MHISQEYLPRRELSLTNLNFSKVGKCTQNRQKSNVKKRKILQRFRQLLTLPKLSKGMINSLSVRNALFCITNRALRDKCMARNLFCTELFPLYICIQCSNRDYSHIALLKYCGMFWYLLWTWTWWQATYNVFSLFKSQKIFNC